MIKKKERRVKRKREKPVLHCSDDEERERCGRFESASSSPRPLSLAASRIQRLARPLRKHHSVAIVNAAPLQLALSPLDDDDNGDDDFATSSSSSSSTPNLPLLGRRVLITAPRSYAASMGGRLLAAGARPLSLPGVRTLRLKAGSREESELDAALRELLGISNLTSSDSSSSPSKAFAAVAFTSRAGIEAVLERVAAISGASEFCSYRADALAAGGAALAAAAASSSSSSFSLWALGADADALASAGIPSALIRTPREASTSGMVEAMALEGDERLGFGYANERVLCPVPAVVGGLAEPAVVPRFLKGLQERVGAVPVRVAAYSTAPPADARRRGAGGRGFEGESSEGARSSTAVVAPSAAAELSLLSTGEIDAVVFSSTAEAQGLAMAAGGVGELLGMIARGNEARREKKKRRRRRRSRGGSDLGLNLDLDLGLDFDPNDDEIVFAAHGPYTAAGASEVLKGLRISVVPEDFSTFAGVVGALEEEFRRRAR